MAAVLCPVRSNACLKIPQEGPGINGVSDNDCEGKPEVSLAIMGCLRPKLWQEAAGNPAQLWAKVDPSIYAQCFTGQAISTENWCTRCQCLDHTSANCPYRQRKQPQDSMVGAGPGQSTGRNEQQICMKFNKFNGDCKFGKDCRYFYVCSACRENHPVSCCKLGSGNCIHPSPPFNPLLLLSPFSPSSRYLFFLLASVTFRYEYCAQLLVLDSCAETSEASLPSFLSKVVTPLKVHIWERELATHPDQEFAACILRGIKQGFRIGFNRSSVQLRCWQGNMHSASE